MKFKLKQLDYLRKIANSNLDNFIQQGFATAGHNGPHGHIDTPIRNTGHYLIIYSFLYKRTKEEKYMIVCQKFANYIIEEQKKTKSGAVQCMITDKFDHLNGLIGQAWVMESLLYYYELSKDDKCLQVAKNIYESQFYNKTKHLWHRVELDGQDIGIDPTYNHQVWFAACAAKLASFLNDKHINEDIRDFLTLGAERDFRIYKNGLLRHYVNVNDKNMNMIKVKHLIKLFLSPFKIVSPKKMDPKYIEHAYHIFDLYGFSILKQFYPDIPLFSSDKYMKAVKYAIDIDMYNKKCCVEKALKTGKGLNVFSYPYNSPAFELPFVALVNGFDSQELNDNVYETQRTLMFDEKEGQMLKMQPDIDTWNARTYEIVRYCDLKESEMLL